MNVSELKIVFGTTSKRKAIQNYKMGGGWGDISRLAK